MLYCKLFLQLLKNDGAKIALKTVLATEWSYSFLPCVRLSSWCIFYSTYCYIKLQSILHCFCDISLVIDNISWRWTFICWCWCWRFGGGEELVMMECWWWWSVGDGEKTPPLSPPPPAVSHQPIVHIRLTCSNQESEYCSVVLQISTKIATFQTKTKRKKENVFLDNNINLSDNTTGSFAFKITRLL